MVDRDRRFFLRVPEGYFEMTKDEQEAGAMAMWRQAMVQMGEDPDEPRQRADTGSDVSRHRGLAG